LILPGPVIREFIEHGLISIEPAFDPNQLRPFGLRVHLAPDLLIAEEGQTVDLSLAECHTPRFLEEDLRNGPLCLAPGGFVIASTVETFRIARTLVCRLDGRSTLARLGLLVHCSASVVDGNHGEHRSIVLELANVGPFNVVLPGGIGIAMATFEQVLGEAEPSLEQDQYRGQRGAVPPNLGFKIPRYAGLGGQRE
jgi:dCTP deaminase